MNIISLLDKKTVFPNMEVQSKKEMLDKLIDALEPKVNALQHEAIRKAVWEREKIMSTGVGKGLAIPHGKAAGIEESYAVFAVLKHPIEYEAIDEEPVHLVFLLVGPQSSNSLHIKLLSRISRLMNKSGFREELAKSGTEEEILKVFRKEEEAYFGG